MLEDATESGLPGCDFDIAFGFFTNGRMATHMSLVSGTHVNEGILVGKKVVVDMYVFVTKEENPRSKKEEEPERGDDIDHFLWTHPFDERQGSLYILMTPVAPRGRKYISRTMYDELRDRSDHGNNVMRWPVSGNSRAARLGSFISKVESVLLPKS